MSGLIQLILCSQCSLNSLILIKSYSQSKKVYKKFFLEKDKFWILIMALKKYNKPQDFIILRCTTEVNWQKVKF